MQVYLKEVVATVADTDNTVIKRRQLCATRTFRDHSTLVVHLIFHKPVLQRTHGLGRSILDDSPIAFAEVAILDQLRHTAQRLGSFGEQDNATDRTVEPVYDTTEDIARLGFTLLDIGLHKVGKRRVACLVTLCYLARQLIECQQVIVFV